MSSFRLALANLLHDQTRTAVSVVGAAFAVVLIFMQLGFLGAVKDSAILLFDRLDFDVLLTSREYLDMSRPGTLPRARLAQARAAGGVAEVHPVSVGAGLWRTPLDQGATAGKRWPITILGIDPGTVPRVFEPADRGGVLDKDDRDHHQRLLGRLNVVLLDRRSRPDFGQPYDPSKPGQPGMPPGQMVELNGQMVELAGYFDLGTGFSYSGLLITNEETFGQLTGRSKNMVTFGLVRAEPGVDPADLAARIEQTLPSDTRAYTRDELNRQEQDFWVNATAAGQFFTFGVILAVFVGGIFIYQMMVADIKKHLPEYATLKAVGYRFPYLFWVVVWQSVYLAVAGFGIGLVMALILYELTRQAANFPIAMNLQRMALVLTLTVGMCVGSGLLAVRKVRTANPADLF